ncbi:MAG: MFS transporter [Oscillospiraceae bacterium]|nr:MFS transporter [Oscillospiraceae bacterium]
MRKARTGPTLWTRDFSIITVGSVISMFGNAMAGFAISLFVLDYTDKPLYYALYVFLYTLPQLAAPLIAGPLMDRFSRRKTIYSLDFLSACIYAFMGLMIYFDLFRFWLLAAVTFVVGTINSTYRVAYESFYPMLITEGNFSRAYSIAGTLETLSAVMVPVSLFLYKQFGLAPLLLINALCFLGAALCETRIRDVEGEGKTPARQSYSLSAYWADAKEGVRYLWGEKGLLCVTLYFTFSSLAGGASSVITLPYFKETFDNGEWLYLLTMAFSVAGRGIGGILQYKIKYPAAIKYGLALGVYCLVNVLEGSYLFLPQAGMRIACFLIGILGVTSYTIRSSATQSYVPHERKGRFNGAFIMLNTAGALLGELLAGACTAFLPMRAVLALFRGIALVAAVVIIGGGKKHVKPLYNRES